MDKSVILHALKKQAYKDPAVNPIRIQDDLVVHQLPGGEHAIHADYGLRIFSALQNNESAPRKYIYPRHFQFYGFSHLINGRGWYWTPEKKMTLFNKGQAVLSTPEFVQDYAGYKTSYVQDAISFCGPVADHLFRAGIIKDGIVEIGNTRRLLPIIEQIKDPSLNSQIKANLMLQNLLVEIFFERLEAVPKENHPQISRLLTMIRSKPEKWWAGPEMAAFCNMSLSQFRRVFRNKTGYSPKQYIDMIKIQQSTELLCIAGLSVADVAVRLGYSDPFHFSRRFKQITGISPLNYRRQFG